MPVAFDAISPGSSGQRAVSSTTLSWTHAAVASGVGILVQVSVDGGGPVNNNSTCTVDAVSMTQLAVQQAPGGAGQYVVVYGSVSFVLASGNHAIVFTPSAAPVDMEGGSLSFTGATAWGTPVTGTGTGTTQTVTLVTTGAQNFAAHLGSAGDSVNASPATNRWLNNVTLGAGNSLGNASGGTTPATGGSMVFNWTNNGSDPWAAIAVEVQGPASTPPPQLPNRMMPNRVVYQVYRNF